MCDHCATYRPLIERKPREYGGEPERKANGTSEDGGCCSWRQSCCGGGCCSQIRCTAPQEEPALPTERRAIGYDYGYGRPETRMGMAGVSTGMPERIPCRRREEKLPMCYGGDCEGGTSACENSGGIDTEKCENGVSHPTPRQSDR